MVIGPGTSLGPYTIRSLLGAGGMGEVFLAHDNRLGRDVAIKVLPAPFATDPDRLRRFEIEARATSQLNHPNILTVFDIGTEAGQPYVVAERLEGESLRERLLRGPLTERETLDAGKQIARGLAAAHGRGIFHRDLKPENLFLTRDGHVKILDFGLAKLSSGDPAHQQHSSAQTAYATEPGTVVGTVQYMAPEQLKGQPVDQRADLFSLGVVLYEMVTGRNPFARASGPEAMSAVLTDAARPLDEVREDASPQLSRVVEHSLEKSPDHRFQTARDLLFALESVSAGSSVRAARENSPVASVAPRRSMRGLVLAGVAAVAGLALGWWGGATRNAQRDAPTFARVMKFAATDATEFAPALSPDGKWIAYLADSTTRSDVWVKFLTGGEAMNLTGGLADLFPPRRNDIGGLDISPDGSQLLFAAGPPEATPAQLSTYVIGAPLGGAPRKLIDGGVGARWSPDGKRLVYVIAGGSAGDSLVVADAEGGNAHVVVPVSGGVHAHWPAWSADGNYIYFIRGISTLNNDPSEIVRVAAAGGTIETVVSSSRRAVYPFPSLNGKGLLYSANPTSADLALWWMPWGGTPTRLTTGVGDYGEARLSADNRTLVASVAQDHRSLVVVPTTGDTTTQELLPGTSGDDDPAVSPKEDRLAFSSTRNGDRHIWTSRLDGGNARELTSGVATDERPAWSPDATTIAFVSSRGTARSIWLVAADGSGLRKVVNADVIDSVTWSPDGTELAYSAPAGSAPAIFRIRTTGGEPVRIPTPEGATSPSWSASRNVIAYVSSIPPRGKAGSRATLALMTPDGRAVPAPWTDSPRLSNGNVAWSADAQHIAATTNSGMIDSQVFVFDVSSSGPVHQVLKLPAGRRMRTLNWLPHDTKLIIGVLERQADIILFDQGS